MDVKELKNRIEALEFQIRMVAAQRNTLDEAIEYMNLTRDELLLEQGELIHEKSEYELKLSVMEP